jgi:hypothetical protein
MEKQAVIYNVCYIMLIGRNEQPCIRLRMNMGKCSIELAMSKDIASCINPNMIKC